MVAHSILGCFMRNLKAVFAKAVVFASAVAFPFGGSVGLAQDTADKTSEPVYEAGNGVTPPKARRTPNPEFSELAGGRKVNGVVVLAMIVTPEGKVRDIKVVKSLDEYLDKRAVSAVQTWRFEPGTKDGKPVAVRMRAQVEFIFH